MILRITFALVWTVLVVPCPSILTAQEFKTDVLPILQAHCVRCHGPEKQEAKIRLDTLSTDMLNDRAAMEHWHEVLNVLNAGEMPPEDEPQLATKDRETLTGWVRTTLDIAIKSREKTDGRVVMRRLNRIEYQNTMTELLDLEMDYVRDLPPDAVSADGFRNDGRSLRMSALQLEYYLQTARRALDRAIVVGPPPEVFRHVFTESNVRGWLGKVERHNRLGRQQQFLATMPKDYPEQGDFLVRVTFSANLTPVTDSKPNEPNTPLLPPLESPTAWEFPLLEVAVGYRPDTQILFREFDVVEITSANEQTLEFRGRIEDFPLPVRGQGKYPGLVVRVRNLFTDGSKLPNGKGDKKRGHIYPEENHLPTITIKSVEFRGPVFDQWPPARHRRILFDSPQRYDDESAYVAAVLNRFMTRAFRRPVEEAEVQRMVEFHQSIRSDFPSFEEAIRETLSMVLIQPDFLYLLEPAGDEKRAINDWELASRLSYFLWSTMPDEQLMEWAARGKLTEANVLSSQLDRMLASPRIHHFVDQFTDQWLELNVLDSVAVNKDYHPTFDDDLKQDMRRETQEFFTELIRNNLSTLNLLDSDFTMLNGPLAQHYGMSGVRGRAFRRVELDPTQRRGGLLGHASVLLSNSTGSDSHPVRRAVWVRDRLLNDPPAPPPPDVPSLEEADPKFHELSVREQLEIHRRKEACASCHRDIDPWGIALEHFDAVGQWRDTVRRKIGKRFEEHPVIASDSLPGGHVLDGADSLRTYLVSERKDQFTQALISRLMTYGLGRKLEVTDQSSVEQLAKELKKNGYPMRTLIKMVASSTPFQTK